MTPTTRRSGFPWPRTLRGLVLLGTALLVLPLLLAVGYAAVQLDTLTRESRAVVEQSVETTRQNQRAQNQLVAMERNLRQYTVLQDPELLQIYSDNSAELAETLGSLARLPHSDESRQTLAALTALHRQLREQVNALPESGEADAAARTADTFVAMNAHAGDLARSMRAVIDGRLMDLQTRSRKTRQAMFWQSAVLLPGLLLLALFFTYGVLRPLRKLDRAIHSLGHSGATGRIAVGGPADLRSLGLRLEWLRQRLDDVAEEKNRFLRHMSHELKTPLANIREGTDLLLDGSVGPLGREQAEVTRILRDNGLRLQQLIENLLSFSAWQNRNATLELDSVAVRPLIDEVINRHRLVMSAQKLKIKGRVEPLTLQADQDKLRLVFENLLSNAVKFSPEHGVVHVQVHRDGEHCVLDVADDGPGIPEAERARVFEAFFQGSQRANTAVGGTGIGLSVVAECVAAHGGTVEIVDGVYRGAHLRVRLPLDQPGAGEEPVRARA